MADSKITALTALTTADPATDMFPIVDVSDTTMAASGTTKRISINNILACSPTATLASATITGDLTVDTSTLKVDSANNRVGIGTVTPSSILHILNTAAATRITITDDVTNGRAGYIESNYSDALVIGTTSGVRAIRFSPDNKVCHLIEPSGTFTWYDGAGGTRMTLNATGLGVGVSPSFKLDVQGAGIRLNSGSATGFTILRLGGIASDSFFGFAGNANDIVTGSSAGDTVIGSNKAGANLRFISGNGVLNATLDASGNLLVGTTSGTLFRIISSFLSSSGNGGIQLIDSQSNNTAVFANFSNGTGTLGSITNNNNAGVLYNVTSDKRLKENILDSESASSLIDSLQVRQFDWKVNNSHQRYGFIAQELVTVVPEAVYQPTNSDEMMAVDYSKLVPLLIKEIQSLRTRVQTLEAR
jgi:hypothetical protein